MSELSDENFDRRVSVWLASKDNRWRGEVLAYITKLRADLASVTEERDEAERERDVLRGVAAWAVSPRAVGVSAATIASVMLGVPLRIFDACHPLDPDDLGRCVGLLDAVPAFRSRLHEVAETYPRSAWPELVARWADLETLLRTETPPYRLEKTYRLMLECREAADERMGRDLANGKDGR